MSDRHSRFQYWTILALCGFIGSYAPTVWETIASIAGAFLIGGLLALVDPLADE